MKKNTVLRNPRPREVVEQYLQEKFSSISSDQDKRLPTISELSRSLKVSASTVRTVLGEFSRHGIITSVPGRGTFFNGRVDSHGTRPWRIFWNYPTDHQPSIGSFADGIYMGGWKKSLSMPNKVIPLTDSTGNPNRDAIARSLPGRLDEFDGAILFSSVGYDILGLIDTLEAAGKPVIYLSFKDSCTTTNFVTSDYYRWCRVLGEAWALSGRKRVLAITLYQTTRFSTSLLSVTGLASGLKAFADSGVKIDVRQSNAISAEEGESITHQYLKEGNPPPDAVFACGDYLLYGAACHLKSIGLGVPADVSLAGGGGSYACLLNLPDMTLRRLALERIGAEAVTSICERLDNGGRSVPGKILAADIVGGGSTTLTENQYLAKHFGYRLDSEGFFRGKSGINPVNAPA